MPQVQGFDAEGCSRAIWSYFSSGGIERVRNSWNSQPPYYRKEYIGTWIQEEGGEREMVYMTEESLAACRSEADVRTLLETEIAIQRVTHAAT